MFPIKPAVIIALAAFVVACEAEEPGPPSDLAPEAPAPGAACEAMGALDALDPRRPLPLTPEMAWRQKQNMMNYLVVFEGILDALAREDWEEIVRASSTLESTPEKERMRARMGAGAEGFAALGGEFHGRVGAIGEAARARDAAGVSRATSDALRACTSCHAAFRQEVVDPATWQARTGIDPR